MAILAVMASIWDSAFSLDFVSWEVGLGVGYALDFLRLLLVLGAESLYLGEFAVY